MQTMQTPTSVRGDLPASATGLVAVILAGGAGTRFWPASTSDKPKQFLTLLGERSLLQLSHDRIRALVPPERILVVTAQRFAARAREHLPELPHDNVIAEPMRRDTAAAVALAGLVVERRFGPSVMAVLTADHLIEPVDTFQSALLTATASAREGHAVTFGIAPTFPATGYGYLEVGEALSHGDGGSVHDVTRFHEKPDLHAARAYVESGCFLWNSGMFVWHTDALRAALAAHLPTHLHELGLAVSAGVLTPEGLSGAFERVPAISIDKGVMEHLANTRCVRSTFAWSDVGSFPALAPHLAQDAHGNAQRAQLRTVAARKNVVWCEDPSEVVALVGVEDLIVVRAGKRTLVAPLSRAEEIKKLVESLPPEDQ